MMNSLTIYEGENGPVSLKFDKNRETLWANLLEISALFETDKSGVSRHIKNIYDSGELKREATVAKFATVQNEGGRSVSREIEFFNLDLIISVGYKINSKKATEFRQWATKILNTYITSGLVINRSLVKTNYKLFQKAVGEVKSLIPQTSSIEAVGIIDLINNFAQTWLSLNAYDKSKLPRIGTTVRKIDVTATELTNAISELKNDLRFKNEATELFAKERDQGNIQSILRNIYQSFSGQEAYPSIEAKAAHLLYFMIKDHPFIDGNKRSGAFAFLWFLKKAGLLNPIKISPELITTLTIMVAESRMEEKEKMLGVIIMVLQK